MSKRQVVGLIGSAMLFMGVFAPIVHLPIVGNLNYFMNGRGDGVIVILLAVISCIFVLLKKYKIVWLSGMVTLGVLFWTYINLQGRITSATEEMKSQLAGNPFAGLGELAMQSVQLQWGWVILALGGVLVIISAVLKEEDKS